MCYCCFLLVLLRCLLFGCYFVIVCSVGFADYGCFDGAC